MGGTILTEFEVAEAVFMADKEKHSESHKPGIPYGNYSAQNDLSYHFSPYGGSTTFKNMKKKAEQAITDHEFKG